MTGRLLLAFAVGAALSGPPQPSAAQEAPAAAVETGAAAGAGSPAAAEPAAPSAADGSAGSAEALLPPSPTAADLIVETVILPSAERLTGAAVALQNAVVRHCLAPTRRSFEAVEDAFDEAVVAAGEAESHAFGLEAHRDVPAMLTTEVANTAFSRSRLEGIMNGRIAPPASLAAMAAEEPGLTGLPALERLLLLPPYAETETIANRCRLAVPIAAKVRALAHVVEARWRGRALDPQWTNEEPELADRLRLRDLIQAMIDVSDRLDRDVSQFGPDPLGNDRLPFADKRRMELYLDAVAIALLREARVVSRFAAPEGPASETLARVMAAIEQGRELLPGSDPERQSAVELFRRAQQEVAQLPAAFDFAPAAFQRPLASFEPPTPPPPPPAPGGGGVQ